MKVDINQAPHQAPQLGNFSGEGSCPCMSPDVAWGAEPQVRAAKSRRRVFCIGNRWGGTCRKSIGALVDFGAFLVRGKSQSNGK